MYKKLVEDIRKNMESKSTDELLKIWKENDREQYSGAAFEAVKQLLSERGEIPPPQKEMPQFDYERIKSLPPISFHKAISIDNNMRTWSQILLLWLIFGILWVIKGFSDIQQFGQAISNISAASSGFFKVDPEMQETINRLSPYLDTFRKLQEYLYVSLFVSFIGWLSLFKIRPMFVARSQRGPKMFLILLCVYLLVDIVGVALTLHVKASQVHELLDIYQLRIFPFVWLLFILTLLPLFGKNALLYYKYAAMDPELFRRPGIAWAFLSPNEIDKRKNKMLARRKRSLKALIVYGFLAVALLVSFVSGIYNVKVLSGLLIFLAVISVIWLIVESTLLASSMYSSPLLVALGGIITYGIVGALVVAYLLPKSKKELSLVLQH